MGIRHHAIWMGHVFAANQIPLLDPKTMIDALSLIARQV